MFNCNYLLLFNFVATINQSQVSKTGLDLLLGNIPYMIVLSVLFLAIIYSWTALKQYRLVVIYRHNLNQIERIIQALDSYLAIVTHQINPQVALIKSTLELLSSNGKNNNQLQYIKTIIDKFDNLVDELLVANRVSNARSASKKTSISSVLPRLINSSRVLIPMALAYSALIVTFGLSSVLDIFDRPILNMLIEFIFLSIAISTVVFANRYHNQLLQTIKNMSHQLNERNESYKERVKFVNQSCANLIEEYKVLNDAGLECKQYDGAKPFLKSLGNLGITINSIEQVRNIVVDDQRILFDIATFVRKASAKAQATSQKKHLNFKVEIIDNLAMRVPPADIRFIVNSLIDNAIRFSKQNTDNQSKIVIRLAKRGDMVEFSVEDKGTGISAHRLPSLLNPFAKGADAIQLNYTVTGLSLYMIKIIVAKLDGQLTIQSHLGEGTKVTVELPYVTS